MKVVILCGGKGLRLKADDENTPKPLARVNGRPIIWHIMKRYSNFGYNDFILPLGYKGEKIKEYFINYEWMNHDFIKDNQSKLSLLEEPEKWNISFVDTGIDTMTGGRIKRIEKYIDGDTFMLTYGDGLADINIKELLRYHKDKGKIATVTGVERKSQYGILDVHDGIATSFNEKTVLDGLVNGGFFVLDKEVLKYIDEDDECVFEKQLLTNLARNGELAVYVHNGIWLAVDTNKDLIDANKIWKAN